MLFANLHHDRCHQANSSRPQEKEYEAAIAWLESTLDAAAAKHLNPGRTETFRRLNRTEYQNAIRDLLGIDIDVASLLPPDESSHGFDNITVTDLSPTLLNRYLSAAQKISRLAVGRVSQKPSEDVFRIRPDITQDAHVEGLPIGTRGGTSIAYNFPQDGEYEIQIRLMRDRNEEVESLHEAHELEVLLDRERAKLFTVKPPTKGASQSIPRCKSEYAHQNDGRAAQCGRNVSREVGVAAGNDAAAAECAFQLLPASAAWAGRLSGFDHRPV